MKGSKDVLKILKNEGIFISDIPAISNTSVKKAFSSFISQPFDYKKQFLQKHYDYAFDGYSFYGQEDSSNQAYDDMLDTFVFSDLNHAHKYPNEFNSYLQSKWATDLQHIRNLELAVAEELGVDMTGFGHMVSANYYPPAKGFTESGEDNTRLSAHPDVSLFTMFPFGVTEGFSFQDKKGNWHTLPANNKVTIFPGYLCEVATRGEIKALNHRVDLPQNLNEERYSFAFFSLPKKGTAIKTKSGLLEAGSYFKMYLDLF